MMTQNGGFQSLYPPNGNANRNFHRSNTYMPPNPYQDGAFPPQPQPYIPPSQVPPLQHTNTYMPPPPQMYQPPPQPQYQPPPPQYQPPPQPQYQPPPPQYQPPPQPQYQPPPPQYQPPPPQNPLQRSHTFMPEVPYQNTPPPYQNPPPMNPPQPLPPQPLPPQQQPFSALGRSNTYRPSMPNIGVSPLPPLTDFNPERDCQILRNAVHGFGTDEKAIINLILNRNAAQRAEIRRCYKSCFGKDLISRLKEDTSGNFKQVIAGMFMTPAEYDAMCLYKAMKGLGTDEGVLIEIIGTRTNEQLREVKDVFEREYKGSLEKWVIGDTSRNFKNLLVALLQCDRSTNPNPDPNMCQADAQALYQAGEGRWGTDEPTFIKIFAKRSAAELAMINDCYLKLRGKGLLKAIDKEFSGDMKKLLQTVVGGLLDPAGYFAMRIREAVKGLGTNNSKLVRVIVSRSEIDLGYIKQAYQRMYQRDMLNDVRSDTSGYYRDILTGLIARV